MFLTQAWRISIPDANGGFADEPPPLAARAAGPLVGRGARVARGAQRTAEQNATIAAQQNTIALLQAQAAQASAAAQAQAQPFATQGAAPRGKLLLVDGMARQAALGRVGQGRIELVGKECSPEGFLSCAALFGKETVLPALRSGRHVCTL